MSDPFDSLTGDKKLDALLELIDMKKLLDTRVEALQEMEYIPYYQEVGLILGYRCSICIEVDGRKNKGVNK